jgi:S1-C subfamily serine protease
VEKLKLLQDGRSLAMNRLGIGLEKLTLKIASALNYPFHGGLVVNDLTEDTAGRVRRGEVLVRIANIPVYDFSAIRRALEHKHYGDTVDAVFLSVIRKNNRTYIAKRDVVLKVR